MTWTATRSRPPRSRQRRMRRGSCGVRGSHCGRGSVGWREYEGDGPNAGTVRCVMPDRKQIADSSRLDSANTLRGQFRKQGYPAGNDYQAEERCHEDVDIVFHDVPPLLAGCREPAESVERASPLPGHFHDDEEEDGKPEAEQEHQGDV